MVKAYFWDILFSVLLFFNKLQFTWDLHDALNLKNNSSFDFSLEAILLQIFKNRIFWKINTKFYKFVLKLPQD